jgi:hypothetical protein
MWNSATKRTITVSADADVYKLYDIDSGDFTEISASAPIEVHAKPVVVQWNSNMPNNSVKIHAK